MEDTSLTAFSPTLWDSMWNTFLYVLSWNEVSLSQGYIDESSSPGEFHPQTLTDPDVTVSRHPALIIQLPYYGNLSLPPGSPPIAG